MRKCISFGVQYKSERSRPLVENTVCGEKKTPKFELPPINWPSPKLPSLVQETALIFCTKRLTANTAVKLAQRVFWYTQFSFTVNPTVCPILVYQ